MSFLTQHIDLFRVFRAFRGLIAVFRIIDQVKVNIDDNSSLYMFNNVLILRAGLLLARPAAAQSLIELHHRDQDILARLNLAVLGTQQAALG